MIHGSAIHTESLERFEITEQLGKSSLATTFKAIDRYHKRVVVIKVLAHAVYQERDLLQQIRRTIKQHASLEHPSLMPILRAKETGDGFYWVLPYMTGGNLQQRIDSGLLTQEEARFMTKRLTEGLVFLHRQGIQHLNLKPTNVLFNDAGQVQLADISLLPLIQHFKDEAQIPDEKHRREEDFIALRQIESRALEYAPSNAIRKHWVGVPETLDDVRDAGAKAQYPNRPKQIKWIAALSALCLLLFIFGQFAPLIGASVAPQLRKVLGNERVALLETTLFRMQDRSAQIRYELGLAEPEAPWESPPQQLPTIEAEIVQEVVAEQTAEPTVVVDEEEVVVVSAETPPLPTWQTLPNIPPLGTVAGEGIWQPYLTDTINQTVARRTFLQPDPARPLTVAGVIAFDLTQVELNYALGSQEPRRDGGPLGTGLIPTSDRNQLIATFNGGFMSTHGGFGAMADDLLVIPPREKLATVAIDPAGQVQIGAWGTTIRASEAWAAYRQNARLIVADGEINPDVYNDSIADWGGTINSEIVTWRSAIALNAERTILYYVAGSSLSMPALADTLVALGAENGMLLDINPYWVHFAAIRPDDGSLRAEAMFEEDMSLHVDRYLRTSERDFFYVTLR